MQQGKGVVKFFLVVMTIVTLVQYFFILPTQKVERQAEEFALQATQDLPQEEQKDAFKRVRTEFLTPCHQKRYFAYLY
jgi:SecD/SecF fusion protein